MANITAAQAQTIADWYTLIAGAFTAAAELPGLSAATVLALTDTSGSCARQSSNLATNAAQVAFANAATAFQDISDAASQAAAVAKKLSADAARTNELLKIGAQAITFAEDALTGKYSSALSDLVALVGTPKPGQGAADPLGA
jgi:UDP-3-O-[3-hydroxymyristoyl] glucosamine N-acyltransferase